MKERYDYSAYSYGMVETVLQVSAEDTRDIVNLIRGSNKI